MARIYLSSTYEDLKAHRAAVVAILRKMRHDVVGMEDYAAADDRPAPRCEEDAGAADIYVGIFAWRYGHVPSFGAGRSITEREYRAATAANVPRLVFLTQDEAPWPPPLIDALSNQEAGQRVKALRAELKENHSFGVFTSPDDLAAGVAAAVAMKGAEATSPAKRRISVDLARWVVRHELGESEMLMALDVLRQAKDATVLELDSGAETWWSTRMQLVALVAGDYTSIEAIAFLHNDRFLGTVPVRALRQRMRDIHSQIEIIYRSERASAAVRGVPRDDELQIVLLGVVRALQQLPAGGEGALAQVLDVAWLEATLGPLLLRDRVEAASGALGALEIYDILAKPGRFVGLVRGDQLVHVIDRQHLAVEVAPYLVRDQLRP